ncbi:MAG: response regulator transcription factor [Rubrivivax sp.]|jgi:two-component system OmpR family response regulator|nr:response regulator transcription factor [Rubrivivax sp.]
MRLLLVEDHAPLAEALAGGLRRAGFAVDVAGTVGEARSAASAAPYDLAVLDLGLPDGSGLDLLREWRGRGGPPAVLLTARGALGDRVAGLDEGADDYVVKPVEMPELVARCRAVLRRPGQRAGRLLEAGHLVLDTTLREATCRGVPLALGRRETGVLEALLRRRNRVVPRSVLLEQLYDRDADVGLNAVDAAVSRLRRALEASDAGVELRTVRGVGWMLTGGAE